MELTDLLFSLGKYRSMMATLCRGTGKRYPTLFFFILIHPIVFFYIINKQNVPPITTLHFTSAACLDWYEPSSGVAFYNGLKTYVHLSMK